MIATSQNLNANPDLFERREIAAKARVSPPTVDRYFAGLPTRPASRAKIEAVIAKPNEQGNVRHG